MALTLALVLLPSATAHAQPRVIVALLPQGTNTGDIAKVPGFSPGLWSAGLSTVPVFQTYLDISQGNRIFTSLYPGEDIEDVVVGPRRVENWPAIVKRAEDAPSDTVPGLLAQTLEDAGVRVRVHPLLNAAALIGVNRAGMVDRRGSFDCAKRRCPPGVTVVPALPRELAGLRRRLRGNDLLIALERPPPVERESLAIGIAGRGFDGNLTSDNTRTNGFVTAPDLAPTILERFGLATPSQMIGKPIHAEGAPDVGAINKLEDRLSVVASRRHEVIMINVLSWIALAAGAIAIGRRRGARVALPLLGLSVIYMPLVLLATAGLEPSRLTERLAVGLGSPLLALATWAAFRGYAALAIACALTVGAYAIDMIFGSPLTRLDLLGPNPAIGVRFFGIGNELEATFAVLVPAGVGAGLAAWGWRGGEDAVHRRAIAAFLGVGALAALIFGLGRFGADVGAVIVLPAGAAVAAAVAAGTGGRRRTVLLIIAAPVLALAILVALDLILGGGAHLTSSVLRAGGASGVADVAQRRIELSVKSFGRAATSPYLYITAVALALAVVYRRRLAELLGNRLVFAGVCGAAAATVLGTVANDSGAVLLMIGTGFLLACGAFLIGIEGEE